MPRRFIRSVAQPFRAAELVAPVAQSFRVAEFIASVAQPFRAAGRRLAGLKACASGKPRTTKHAFIAAGLLVACGAVADGQGQNPAAPVATATIRGHVVAAESGQPLRKAQVRLMLNQPIGPATNRNREPRTATTDADGRYEFADLVPGRYTLTAFKTGFINQTWGAAQSGAPIKPFEIRAGEVVDRVDFSLQRGGVIAGRIVDEFGEPLSRLQVAAVQMRMVDGRRDVQQMNSVSTDDLGDFRIFGLTPGQYYVKATWQRQGAPIDPISPDRSGYPETFFPGTVRVDQAQRFTVRAGQTISDLAMALSPVSTVRAEGSIVDASGKPFAGAMLMVIKTDGDGGGTSGAPVRPDGTFVVTGLTPGEYVLRAQPMPPRKDAATATMKVTVGTEDIKNVRLIAVPPSTISGRVVVDPAQAQSLPNPLMLTMMPVDRQFFMGMEPVRLGDDLSFEMSAAAGRYRINWMNLPPPWIIRAVRINNGDVTDDDLEVKPGENLSSVEIELTNKTGTIAGSVTTPGGVAAKDYRLVVFAADKKLWTSSSRYFRIGGPDQDGRFTVTGLPPGNYSVLARER